MAEIDLGDFEENNLFLVVVPSDLLQQTNIALLKYFLNSKNAACVYVTIAKPYKTMLNILEKNAVKTDKIFFIDCITQVPYGVGMQRMGNVVFMSPQALTNISITLSSAMQSFKKDENRVLFLDSISTLILYNESKTVTRFVHFLTGKIREWGVKSVVLTIEEEIDKNILSQLTTFFDKVVRVAGDGVNGGVKIQKIKF